MNTPANKIVSTSPYKDLLLFPSIKEWWQKVTVIPDANNNIVFSKGSSKGLIVSTSIGGQWDPTSTVGDKALWKKAQNIAKKNNASDAINKPTPIFNPLCTANVWFPKNVPSADISLNHSVIELIKDISEKSNTYFELLNKWKYDTPEVVNAKSDILQKIGQGEGETKWKGCAWNLLRYSRVIHYQ